MIDHPVDKSESLILCANSLNIQRSLLTNEQAQGNPLQNHKERVENLLEHDHLIKLCTDAGFIKKTVDVAPYFMTKDTEEFSQFDGHVPCREYTVHLDDESSRSKAWIRGDIKIGLVLEVIISYHQGEHGVEIRTESLSKDGCHSWIRISNGLNKIVRILTEKVRIYENNEDNWAATANRLHETRIGCKFVGWVQ